MNRRRTLIVLMLALLSGSLAGYSALRYMRTRPQPIATAVAPASGTQVVVAARDMPVGTILGPQDVTVVNWPSNAVPVGYARTVPEVVGRGVITAVRMNEPLLASKLADKAAGGGLPIVIPEGMRAVSIRVDEVVQVSGFVTPQTRVDVVLTVDPPGGGGEKLTQIVYDLENVQVLAAGQVIQKDEQGKPIPVSVVTMLVTPEQAEKLITASTQGRIQLALRNTLDVKQIKTDGSRMAQLLRSGPPAPRSSGGRPARAAAPRPEKATIEVFQGGVRTLKTF